MLDCVNALLIDDRQLRFTLTCEARFILFQYLGNNKHRQRIGRRTEIIDDSDSRYRNTRSYFSAADKEPKATYTNGPKE